MNEFVAFRILWNSNPMSDEAMHLVCACLNWYVKRSGKSLDAIERCLALYKLGREMEL
jgi:hypothetical protein